MMLRDAGDVAGERVTHVRWRIFAFLFGFGFLAYVQQKGITVAAERMMPELHLTQLQIGWLEQAFVLGYALFQIPGGVIGQRLGARRTFVLIGLTAFAATVATPLLPGLFSGSWLFATLLGAQCLLGCSQGAIFPVSAGVFEAWFPPRRWCLVQGMQSMGLQLGAALTPPLIAFLMVALGWQGALFWSSLPALALIGLWAWQGRNSPRLHPAVSSGELALIGGHRSAEADASIDIPQLLRLLGNRNVVLLAFSYMCMNYTFYLLSNWVFLYLVQERGFSLLEGGWLAMAPLLVAALGAGVGGPLTAALCQRFGDAWGFRSMPLLALPLSALLLLVAVNSADAYLAVAALAACFGVVELTEGAYWAAGMNVGRGDTMAVCGVMNTGGNLGGIIGIPIVGYLSGHHAWHLAFAVGAGCALLAAAAWLGIEITQPAEPAGCPAAVGVT